MNASGEWDINSAYLSLCRVGMNSSIVFWWKKPVKIARALHCDSVPFIVNNWHICHLQILPHFSCFDFKTFPRNCISKFPKIKLSCEGMRGRGEGGGGGGSMPLNPASDLYHRCLTSFLIGSISTALSHSLLHEERRPFFPNSGWKSSLPFSLLRT